MRSWSAAPLRRVGILEYDHGEWLVRPHGRVPLPPVHIDAGAETGAAEGDLVVVEPAVETLNYRTVRGRILERLGNPESARAWILGVIRRLGIPAEFPARVHAAAAEAAERFAADDLPDRTDLRDLLTVTIDPPDAKDFDDAFSVEHLAGGRTRLGVHIADVTHFTAVGDPLDVEAHARVQRVFPRLRGPHVAGRRCRTACAVCGQERRG